MARVLGETVVCTGAARFLVVGLVLGSSGGEVVGEWVNIRQVVVAVDVNFGGRADQEGTIFVLLKSRLQLVVMRGGLDLYLPWDF